MSWTSFTQQTALQSDCCCLIHSPVVDEPLLACNNLSPRCCCACYDYRLLFEYTNSHRLFLYGSAAATAKGYRSFRKQVSFDMLRVTVAAAVATFQLLDTCTVAFQRRRKRRRHRFNVNVRTLTVGLTLSVTKKHTHSFNQKEEEEEEDW